MFLFQLGVPISAVKKVFFSLIYTFVRSLFLLWIASFTKLVKYLKLLSVGDHLGQSQLNSVPRRSTRHSEW